MPNSIRVRKKSVKKNNSTDISLLVSAETDDVYFEWDRSKIVNALKNESHVGDRTAKSIARAIEKRVLNSKIKKISTSLIRELVDNELFERGLQKKLEKQTSIGLPKSDIDELIFSKSQENSNVAINNPEAIQQSLSETILKQYALQEVFSEEVSEAHKTGKVHLHDLGACCRVYAFSKNTQLKVRINNEIKMMTMKELYEYVDNDEIKINETQYAKDASNLELYVLDRQQWTKLKRIIYSDELKDMVKFIVNGKEIKVTSDHGCVVKRDGIPIIIRADEIKNTDKFIYMNLSAYGDVKFATKSLNQ